MPSLSPFMRPARGLATALMLALALPAAAQEGAAPAADAPLAAPEAAAPEAGVTETASPETAVSGTGVPQDAPSEATAPDAGVTEDAGTEAAAPDAGAGQTAAPQAAVSEAPAPRPAGPAADAPPQAPAVAHGLQGHDLSPMGMYRQADVVVKAVMIALLAAAVLAWIILVVKLVQLAAARAQARKVLQVVARAADLPAAQAALQGRRGVAATLVRAAGDEMAVSQDLVAAGVTDGLKDRVASRLARIEAAAARKIGQGVGLLASIGSVGPFVGLFGTVWGIMNAFIGIAESQTTNLAVVAPGIAEALLATALGLVAAIPAVIIYNALARATTGYRALLADLSAATERLVSRDLDRAAATAGR